LQTWPAQAILVSDWSISKNLLDFLDSSPLKPFGQLFQSRRFFEIDQSETRIAYGSHIC
jgi:hypothetical protein